MEERVWILAAPSRQNRHLGVVVVDEVVREGSEVSGVGCLIAIEDSQSLRVGADSDDWIVPGVLVEGKVRRMKDLCNTLKFSTQLVVLACISVSTPLLSLALHAAVHGYAAASTLAVSRYTTVLAVHVGVAQLG